ncbi:MAG TPA: trypsin-like peptidase domain-containing protein, partial [Chitinophaga sp.]
MKKLILRYGISFLLYNLSFPLCFAQEKGINIIAGRPPYATLEEKQAGAIDKKGAAPSLKAPAANISFRYAAGKALPGVVHILSTYQPGYRGQPLYPYSRFYPDEMWPNSLHNAADNNKGSASGVLLSNDGYIVTNCHVVKDAREIEVILYNQLSYKARIVGIDSLTDLALIKIDDKALPFVTFGASDSVSVGDWVLAIGNPFNLASTVTAGIISAKSRSVNTLEEKGGLYSFIQTDA